MMLNNYPSTKVDHCMGKNNIFYVYTQATFLLFYHRQGTEANKIT